MSVFVMNWYLHKPNVIPSNDKGSYCDLDLSCSFALSLLVNSQLP